jgi:hypothetical protein
MALDALKPMRSKVLDEGVTAPGQSDELDQAVKDAETERYTAAQVGHISFVQKNASTPASSSKVAKKSVNATTSEELLEKQAKAATIEKPVYTQVTKKSVKADKKSEE